MKIDEFLKNEKNLDQAAECKDIDEFKKFIDKNNVFYFTEEQLKKAWNYVRACFPGQDGSLDDNALEVVAGGGSVFSVGCMAYGCFPRDKIPSVIETLSRGVETIGTGQIEF